MSCKYFRQKKQYRYTESTVWNDVIPYEYQKGALYEVDSPDCDTPTFKLNATYSDSTTYEVECNSSTTLSQTEVRGHSTSYSSMTTAEIGDCVTSLSYTFYGCSSLTSVIIPDSVTSIGIQAFNGCSGLTSITISDSVTSIGSSAFRNCSSLTSVTIGTGVTSIGDSAFYGCSGLTSATIGNSVTSIGRYAFRSCSSLTGITIPDSVTSISNDAFDFCSNIGIMAVDSNNTIYDSRNNCNAIIETASNTLIHGCKNTVIPNSVTSIGNFAFRGRSTLTGITIPNSVTSIGESAFASCSGLTSVTIPDSVTSIGTNAFTYCVGFTSVTCLVTNPPTLGSNVFNNTNNCPIYVPASSVNAYKTASGWSTYASRIQAIT